MAVDTKCVYDDGGSFCYTHETEANRDGSCPGFDPINAEKGPGDHTIVDGLDVTPLVGIADIVRGLLETEHDRLMRDHYDDDVRAACDGCRHAAIIARTLATTIEIR